MNSSEPTIDTPITPKANDLKSKVGKLQSAIGRLGGGDKAQLRRGLSRSTSPSAAFYWLLSRIIDENPSVPISHADEDLWHLICASIAKLDALAGGGPLGAALRESDFSEVRMLRLLRADRDNVREHLRAAVYFLVSKGKGVSTLNLAYFVLSVDSERRERVRRDVARDFFREKSAS